MTVADALRSAKPAEVAKKNNQVVIQQARKFVLATDFRS
jgi:hypothetical protein